MQILFSPFAFRATTMGLTHSVGSLTFYINFKSTTSLSLFSTDTLILNEICRAYEPLEQLLALPEYGVSLEICRFHWILSRTCRKDRWLRADLVLCSPFFFFRGNFYWLKQLNHIYLLTRWKAQHWNVYVISNNACYLKFFVIVHNIKLLLSNHWHWLTNVYSHSWAKL